MLFEISLIAAESIEPAKYERYLQSVDELPTKRALNVLSKRLKKSSSFGLPHTNPSEFDKSGNFSTMESSSRKAKHNNNC